MKALIAGAALAFLGVAANAQSLADNPPTVTTLCIDVGGRSLPAICQVPGSRLDAREDICICPRGERIQASVCPPGVRPPAEGVALERARRALLRNGEGTIVGATFQGQPMCVAPRLSVTR